MFSAAPTPHALREQTRDSLAVAIGLNSKSLGLHPKLQAPEAAPLSLPFMGENIQQPVYPYPAQHLQSMHREFISALAANSETADWNAGGAGEAPAAQMSRTRHVGRNAAPAAPPTRVPAPTAIPDLLNFNGTGAKALGDYVSGSSLMIAPAARTAQWRQRSSEKAPGITITAAVPGMRPGKIKPRVSSSLAPPSDSPAATSNQPMTDSPLKPRRVPMSSHAPSSGAGGSLSARDHTSGTSPGRRASVATSTPATAGTAAPEGKPAGVAGLHKARRASDTVFGTGNRPAQAQAGRAATSDGAVVGRSVVRATKEVSAAALAAMEAAKARVSAAAKSAKTASATNNKKGGAMDDEGDDGDDSDASNHDSRRRIARARPTVKKSVVQDTMASPTPKSKAQEGWEKIQASILTSSQDNTKGLYKFVAITGNSTFLVINALKHRGWWIRTTDHDSLFSFKWKPTSSKINWSMMGMSNKQCVNHLEGHHSLTTKAKFFNNLKAYYEKEGMDVFENVPVTYTVNLEGGATDKDWMAFQRVYKQIAAEKPAKDAPKAKASQAAGTGEGAPPVDESIFRLTKKIPNTEKHRSLTGRSATFAQYDLKRNGEENIWIVKPTHLNRGIGVLVFTDIKEIHEYITGEGGGPWIVQKYLERPLLIDRRKFDIRCYVVVSMIRGFEVHFYKDGYLRTASAEYAKENVKDRTAHLTNNAVQKKADGYGEFEDGNMMNFDVFQDYINRNHGGCVNVRNDLVPKMKELVLHSALAVRKEFNPNNIENTFELFGYDFMLDDQFKLYMIEVNTNPCLELVSDTVKDILPRMIEDALQITVDVAFPPPRNHPNSSSWKKWPPVGHKNGFDCLFYERS